MKYKLSITKKIKYFSFLFIICIFSFTENASQAVAENPKVNTDLIDAKIERNRTVSDSLTTLAIIELQNFKPKVKYSKPRIIYIYVRDTVYKKRAFLGFLKRKKN